MNKNLKTIICLGLGLGALNVAYSARNQYAKIKRNEIEPLSRVSQEAELYDTNPKDGVLSSIETEKFIKELVDKDKDGVLSKAEITYIRDLINSLVKAEHNNTTLTAKNLQNELEFFLIRQHANDPDFKVEQFVPEQKRAPELSYSDFYRLVFLQDKPIIKKVILGNGSNELTAVFLDNSQNTVTLPSDITSLKDLADKLTEKSIEVEVGEASNGASWLVTLMMLSPIALMGLFLFVATSGRSKLLGGRPGTMHFNKDKPGTTFADVAGIDEAKQDLKELVDFIKNPDKYKTLGAKVPKGVLLVGAPGTGKTLSARAVAGEAGVPFFSLSGSEFVEYFVGAGASKVRSLFKDARNHAPCVVFIDEIDAVGRQRGTGMGGGHDEREQTLNQLLVEMDGFVERNGVIVLAATNRPDVLDAALLRPGRFDRQIVIDRPDVKGRTDILKVHAKDKKLSSDVDLETLARGTPGFTGADLANVLNEAALVAGRKNKDSITNEDLEDAKDRVIAGVEKTSKIISPEEKKITAVHEIGHTLVSVFDKKADPVHKVTIIPRGMALGVTITLPEEEHNNYSKSQLMSKIRVLLGGRVAEEIVLGDITTGAQNDLDRATDLARKMVMRFGMSEKVGLLTFGQSNENVFLGRDFGQIKNYSEQTAYEIDVEMKSIVDKMKEEVTELLTSKRKHLDALTQAILEKETLDKNEIARIVSEVDSNTMSEFAKNAT